MKILSIDTAHGICSVAVAENGAVIAQREEYEQSRQAERLFLIIEEILKENKLSYSQIDAIAANIGPGSFTGVRIGLAAARGIALAAKIPVIGVSGFESLEYKAKSFMASEDILIAFDARREQVFTKFYSKGFGGEEALMSYGDVASLVKASSGFEVAGDAAELIMPHLSGNNLNYTIISDLKLPDAGMTALVALQKLSSEDYDVNAAPLYIRPPDAKLPKNNNSII